MPDFVDLPQNAGTWAYSLRMPAELKPRVDAAAKRFGTSMNEVMTSLIMSGLDTLERSVTSD